ncbi:MAG: tripartite tricarboxylate transporter substrate binding protein [Sphaerotilus natans subsp. sulfidivorans]|uniref:tripartite tricarboxylate transporter substrate binding protein n=1 Tax=Sphaerotilus sulfidivorans TaxID=639200 RepID=UPI002357219A|nr:tripartite tricarboxylate transporter substrate binding protein [Sphaerotilus sulfidivorans]MCK6403314.1 tripartite tricarboxylate transporter substrate binding protein [Sphaerotilus sulfidivorans]
MQRRHFTLAALGAACLPKARAQAWPQRPVKVLQGFAAGGNADAIARLVGTEMSKGLGQPFVVEALAGAGGTLASGAVARAASDGYTMLLATGGHAVAGALYEKLPYQTVTSFQMVSTITFFPFLLVTQADSKHRTLRDVLTAAKTTKGGIAYGSAGVGSTHHLVGELLAKMAGVEFLHVPFRGDSASITALLSGEIPVIIAPPTAVLGQLKAGKLRALAVTGAQRWAGMPEVPTVAEQGVAGFDVRSWAGWMLPAGTPQTIVERLHAETQKALQIPAVKARLEEMGGEVRGSTPQEMSAMVAAELQKWTQVVADARIPRL